MFCGTSQADYLIDNFSMLDDPNAGGGTVTGSQSGGEITAEVTSSVGTVIASSGTGVYSFSAATGDMLSILYDWSGVYSDLSGHDDQDEYLLLSVSSHTGTQSIIPVDVLSGSLADWELLIDAPGASSVVYSDVSLINSLSDGYENQDITAATSLLLKFTYTGTGSSLIQFGGQDLIAVPEPTAFLMFGSVLALGFSRRRRR